ncbi:NADH oxidase, partial [human gut metagenome]
INFDEKKIKVKIVGSSEEFEDNYDKLIYSSYF